MMPMSPSQILKRHLKTLDRACYGGEKVCKKVGDGVIREYDRRIEQAVKIKPGHLSTTDYIEELRRYKKIFRRAFIKSQRAVKAVIKTTNELFRGLSEEEFNQRTEAILRIPSEDLKEFNLLDSEQRIERLKELILEHETGSNGCGYAPNMLNAPGDYSPYYAYESKDPVTRKKKVPPFLYDLIDRFIYEAIKPNFYKKIFFKKAYKKDPVTKKKIVVRHDIKGDPIYAPKKIKKWNAYKRQIRAEGRMGMVKVMIVLIKRLDYKISMRIGKRYKDSETGKFVFIGIPRMEIAETANMSLESVKTALRNLEDVGVLYCADHQYDRYIDKNGDKQCAGVALVRKMKSSIIDTLGLATQKKDEQIEDKKNPRSVDGTTTYQKEELTDDQLESGQNAAASTMKELRGSGMA